MGVAWTKQYFRVMKIEQFQFFFILLHGQF